MNNKKLGTDFERELCRRISESGSWVHFLSPDERGAQPFDVIAVKNGVACAIECKTLNDKAVYFPISRLEENQLLAMDKWMSCGNLSPLIAISWRGGIFAVEYTRLKESGKIDMREFLNGEQKEN